MSKRKLPSDEQNPNYDFCEFLYELAQYEKNVTRNIYKYNVYRQAAETLSKHPTRITSGSDAKKLSGIGEKISQKIDEFLATGKLKKLEQINSDDASTTINLLTQVSGIGPAKAKELYDSGVRSIEELHDCKEKLNHHQLVGLQYFNDFQLRIPRQEVSDIEKILQKEITNLDSAYLVTICGSYRRGKPTSGDVDCLLSHPDVTSQSGDKKSRSERLRAAVGGLTRCGLVTDTLALGNTKFMGVCRLPGSGGSPSRRLDIRLTPLDQYHCSVLYFTGSDLFNRNMRAHALDKGFTLNEYSLRPIGITGTPGNPIPISSEEEIFEYIDYPYKKPEERDL